MEKIKIGKQKWTWMGIPSTYAAQYMAENEGILMSFGSGLAPQSILHGSSRGVAMQGLDSYELSGYCEPVAVESGVLSACGEMSIDRIEGNTWKQYMYAVGVDAGGNYYFHGPLKLRSFHYQDPNAVDSTLGFGYFKDRFIGDESPPI